MSASTIPEEPSNVEQTLGDKNWIVTMDSEYGDDLGEGWLSRNNNFTSRCQKHQVPNNSFHTGLVYLPSYNLLYFYAFSIIPNGPHGLIPFYAYLEHTCDNLVENVSQRNVKRRNETDDITFEIMTPGMQTNFFCSVSPSLFVRFF
jgi:hypothetical protein